MNVQSIKKSTLVKVVCILSVIILFSSCATQTELNLGPTIDKPLFGVSFYIPTVTLAEPIENLGYIVPVTSLRLMPDDSGIIVRTKNINGFETFDVISVKVNRIFEKYALIETDDYYEEITLNTGDQLIDHIPESLQKLNEIDHEWLKDCFQRGKNLQ